MHYLGIWDRQCWTRSPTSVIALTGRFLTFWLLMHPWLSLFTRFNALFGPVLPSRCTQSIIGIHCIVCSAVSSQCTYISDSVMLLAFMYCPSRPIYYSLSLLSDPLCSCYNPHILNPLHPSMSVNVLMVRCILVREGTHCLWVVIPGTVIIKQNFHVQAVYFNSLQWSHQPIRPY